MKISTAFRCFLLSLCLTAPAAFAHDEDPSGRAGLGPEKLGKVYFPVSCDPKVQAEFERGVALLHSFWIGEGYKSFNLVLKGDPSCAIAYWGIAVNRLQNPFGGQASPKFLAEGAAAVERGRSLHAKTQRERDYIDAIGELYRDHGQTPWKARVLAYEKAMAALALRYPDDEEAAIFYALALNIATDLNDQTYAKPLKAAAILEPLFKTHPDHPGVAHYLIHSYDFPPLAEKGLPAARRYADIAPSAPHALHMPAHIFTRVGAWQDSARTNERSEREARRDGSVDGTLHAIDYEVYAYLQMSEDKNARVAIERGMADDVKRSRRAAGPFAHAAIPARYALERGDWMAAAQLQVHRSKLPHAEAITHFARAIGSARSGNPAAAGGDLARLAELRDALKERKNDYWAGQVEIQRLAASAWVAWARGEADDAMAQMRAAADMERASEKAPISPGPILPARELLADMLLESGQSSAALVEYEASQAREPNRFRGLYGATLAAARSGEAGKAAEYYDKLQAIAGRGDRSGLLEQARASVNSR